MKDTVLHEICRSMPSSSVAACCSFAESPGYLAQEVLRRGEAVVSSIPWHCIVDSRLPQLRQHIIIKQGDVADMPGFPESAETSRSIQKMVGVFDVRVNPCKFDSSLQFHFLHTIYSHVLILQGGGASCCRAAACRSVASKMAWA